MHIPKGMTVEKILEKVKDEICNNYCKYSEECTERLENNQQTRPCPLDYL